MSEFFFGFLFNSVSIMSDAVHDLGDSISIGFAWFFQGYSE
ncbi:cation transporter, partial [Desemzia sp. FAM 23991]